MGAVKRVKNGEWEKNRRERLNLTFFELSRLLPDHDPTLTLTKVEILNRTITYIKDLKERNASLIGTNCSEVLETEMTSLRDQVAELQRRNQQLAELLQTAKISLPPRPLPLSIPLEYPKKWAGKLSSDAGFKNISEKKEGESKENPVNAAAQLKLAVKKKKSKIKKKLKTKIIKHCEIKFNKSETTALSSSSNPLRELNNTSSVQGLLKSSEPSGKNTSESRSCVKSTSAPVTCTSVQSALVLSRTVTLPCTTISLVLSNAKTNIVTVAKSNVLPAPIMATGIQPVLQCNPSLSSLGPGTLIMAGGRIVPVPPPPTVLTPALILLPPTTTTVAVTTTRPSHKSTSGLRLIVPKPRQRDNTKTTFANKVPIPAISTHNQTLLATRPKPSVNNLEVILEVKKSTKKKSVLSKQSVKEKQSSTEANPLLNTAITKSLSEILTDKVLESHEIKDVDIDKGDRIDNSKSPDKLETLKKSEQKGQCIVAKRKSEIANENTKNPKIAKMVRNSGENINAFRESKKTDQDCTSFVNKPPLQKTITEIGSKVDSRSNQRPEMFPKPKELNQNAQKNSDQESNKDTAVNENPGNVEDTVLNFGTEVESQNKIEKEKVANKRVGNLITISESSNCDNSNLCSTDTISHKAVIYNPNTEKVIDQNLSLKNNLKKDSQILNEGDKNAVNNGTQMLETSSCLIADTTLSADGFYFGGIGQQISEVHVAEHSVNEKKHYAVMVASQLDANKNNKGNDSANNTVENSNDSVVLNTNNQPTSKLNLKDSTKQKAENVSVSDVHFDDKCQQVLNTSLCVSNTENKIGKNSSQISLDYGLTTDMVFNKNCNNTNGLRFDNNDQSVFKTNANISTMHKAQNQVPNINSNNNSNGRGNQTPDGNCFTTVHSNSEVHFDNNATQLLNVGSDCINSNKKHQIMSTDSLNTGIKGTLLPQSNLEVSKSKNDHISSTGVYSDETCKILNVNSCRDESVPDPSEPRDIFPSSDQKNSNLNIYTKGAKESLSGTIFGGSNVPNSNLKNITSVINGKNPQNSGNNCYNIPQNPHHSVSHIDIVPPKNNPNSYSESFHFSETVQRTSNKTVPVSTNPTSTSFNFQSVNMNNNIRVVSDTSVPTTNSGNFYTNGNCQHQSNRNMNVHDNKLLQNSITVSGNFNFMKTHPNSVMDTSTKSNVPSSSTKQINFINTQKHNPITNNSLAPHDNTQNSTDTSFHHDTSKKINIGMNTNNSGPGLNSGISLKSSNQNHVNMSIDTTKKPNCHSQQQVSKSGENSNKIHLESMKTSVTQSCKSTQVSSLQLSFGENEKHMGENKQHTKQNTITNNDSKKPSDELKSICDNKSLIQDDSQELTSLFPTEKLQSCSESLFRDTDFRDRNLFIPVGHSYMDEMRLNLPHSDFSNDLLSSLQVPSAGQHPESISPTAAFLLAFPLVSTSKTSELIAGENEGGESQHATPTTILQIGNIEPSSSELFHQTALMMENNPNMIKQSKSADTSKDNSSKQMKAIENFNKFQQMEINELMRNENFSRNNCKEKKNFVGLGEQDIFFPCTKKKSNGKTNNYQMPPSAVPHMQDKAFEFSETSVRTNPEQNRQINHNEKKNQGQPENINSSQNVYNSTSQTYAYSSFSSGNEFILHNSTYLPSNNQAGAESSKSISWSTASITSTSSHIDYTAPYCSYPQKAYNNPNQIKAQKNVQTNFEDQRVKEKSIQNTNPLPKFSNFQFNNSHSHQDIHNYPPSNQATNTNYKPEPKTKKLKTGTQRAPVNWMTAPDVRPLLPDPSAAPVLPDVMFHQKDLEFAPAPNNMMMLNSSNNITPFNISTSNNSQTLYPNSHFSGVDLQLDFAPFPEIPTSKSSRNLTSVTNGQQNPHHYSWSPSKTSIPLLPHIDSHMIPSTLPTLVGDLALGTTTPSGPVDTFRNLSMPTTPFNIDTPVKKFEKKHETQKPATKPNEKECFPHPDRRNNRTVPDYCQKTHSHQSTNTSSSFLSVSQLVDQVKTEQSPSARRSTKQSATKASNNGQKRNTSNQQTDKSKVSNNINNHNNYHHSNPGMMTQRKFDPHSGGYQEIQNSGAGFPGPFTNQGAPVPWQNEKPHRSATHYKVSYSAESLIADQSTSTQGHASELPQFPNQYSHPPVVSSASYPSTDFSHQNVQPLEFHQTHQNCFNFPSNSHYTSASFNPDGDYHLGLEHIFNFNPASNKHSTSCQTSVKDNRNPAKRGQAKQQREDFTPQWTPQVYPPSMRPKGPLPPHCPPSTSSPSHQGTTTLTNFNLSTIFPEINDKVGMTGPPPPSHFPPAPNFRPH